jgi:hypothetical protein
MLRKLLLIGFALCFSAVAVLSQNNIKIPGFGDLPFVKTGDNYQIKLKNYGTFDFKGSINPLELEASAAIDDLKNIPGYKVMNNMGLQDIFLKISNDGFYINAKADTKGKLKILTEFLKINEPFIDVSVHIDGTNFSLGAALDYSANPKIIEISKKSGTSMRMDKLELLAGNDGIGAGISVKANMMMKPTKWDPELNTVFELSYNLITQEIIASGSMVDSWSNPFGMSKYFDKDAIRLENAALSLGWIPGSPSPTTLGFGVEKANLFSLEFGIMVAISPANGELAFKAHRNKMTMNDMTTIMREGFKLKVPDIFPDDIYIKDAYVLFSPNGGQVGEFEIEQGFALRGDVKFSTMMSGSIDFYASTEKGFYLELDFKQGSLRKQIEKELKKVPALGPVLGQIMKTLELKRVYLMLKADQSLVLSGKTNIHFAVLGQSIVLKAEGSVDPKAIVDKIVNEIKKHGFNQVAEVSKKVAHEVEKAGKASMKVAESAWGTVGKLAGEAIIVKDHAFHSKSDCDNKCVPKRAKKLSKPMLKGTNKAVENFYYDVIPKLSQIVGDNPEQTKALRSKLVKGEWDKLSAKIDKDWEKIIGDRDYVRFYLKPSSAGDGGNKFRKLVRAEKKKHVDYRNKLWNKLMTESFVPKPIPEEFNELENIYFVGNGADDLYIDIPGYHFNAENQKGTKVSMYARDRGIDRFIKIIPAEEKGYVFIQPQHSDLVLDVAGGSKNAGGKIHLWQWNKDNPNQKFKMISVGGKSNMYYLQAMVSGLYLTSNGKSQSITQQEFTRSKNQQWVLEAAFASDMADLPDDIYAFKNVMAGKYTDLGGSGENISGKDTHIKLWDMDHGPDRYNMLINSHIEDYFFIQPLHSKYVWDMEGGKHANGTKLQLWDLNRSTAQQFRFIFAGSPMTFYIDHPASEKFINASKSNITKNGCPIQIWDRHTRDNVKWRLTHIEKWQMPPANQSFHVKAAYSDKYWDIPGTGGETNKNGKKVKIWSLDGGADRKYRFKPSGDHSWVFVELQNGGKVFDIVGKGGKNGEQIQIWDKSGSNDQKFAVQFTSPTTFSLRTKSWKSVDMKSAKIHDNGTHLIEWDTHYGPAQQFQLIYADGPNKGKTYNFLKGK